MQLDSTSQLVRRTDVKRPIWRCIGCSLCRNTVSDGARFRRPGGPPTVAATGRPRCPTRDGMAPPAGTTRRSAQGGHARQGARGQPHPRARGDRDAPGREPDSSTVTGAPRRARASAATSPVGPAPTTTTSASSVPAAARVVTRDPPPLAASEPSATIRRTGSRRAASVRPRAGVRGWPPRSAHRSR